MSAFREGQRWISEPEPELGLGTVMQYSGDRVEMLYPATGEMRVIYSQAQATNGSALTTAGDLVFFGDLNRRLRALDAADGTVLFHAPVTVGSSYDPSPDGDFRVTAIAHDPSWHYQPSILESVPDDQPEATLPGGPNNAVGVVWMALSKEHYGIHGTSAPGTIGYASSAGCVRLTNWDANELAGMVEPGVTVTFEE